MAYILGEREFWGLPFKVAPAVLVPRPDSETVIEAAIGLLPDRARPLRMLDLGLGSGCLLLTLLHEFPQASGVGIEVSPKPWRSPGKMPQRLAWPRATLLEGDWRDPTGRGTLADRSTLSDLNPPYIEAGDIGGLMPEVAASSRRWRSMAGGTALRPIGPLRPHSAGFWRRAEPSCSKWEPAKPLPVRVFWRSPGSPGPPLERSGWGGDELSQPDNKGLATPRIGINFWLSRKGLGPGWYLPTGNHPS